jgi:hypothetical protein
MLESCPTVWSQCLNAHRFVSQFGTENKRGFCIRMSGDVMKTCRMHPPAEQPGRHLLDGIIRIFLAKGTFCPPLTFLKREALVICRTDTEVLRDRNTPIHTARPSGYSAVYSPTTDAFPSGRI